MKYLFYVLLLIWITCSANAQSQNKTGRISGRVIAAKTGEYLSSATVKIDNTSFLTKTDLDGYFAFSNVPLGTYNLTVSFVSYETKTVTDIVVTTTEAANVNFSMEPPSKTGLDEVVVTSRRSARQETMNSLLVTQKNSAVVSDGIAADIIRRTPDRNTSDVLKRVSGVSIQDNKFAVVRGLNDRYNAAFLNGAPLPSSENDRKAFAFDIFPANMLDNIVILKTASPDLTGEFAGGIININTISIPAKNATIISFGTGYNTQTTFKDGLTYRGGNTDWIGLDDGTRAIPDGMPATKDFPSNRDKRAEVARLYTDNTWGTVNRNTPMNLNFQFSQALNLKRKDNEFFGMLLSATYNKNYVFTGGEINSWEYNRDNPSVPPVKIGSFNNDTHNENTLAGLVANFSFKLNNNNRISLKNILSVNAEDRVFDRNGQPDAPNDPEFFAKSTALWYTSNVISSSQINGDHNLSKSKIRLNWLFGLGNVDRKIPDLRQLQYAKGSGSDDYIASIPSATVSASTSGSRFYSTTGEKIYSAKLDLSRNFGEKSKIRTQVKIGGNYQFRDRDFNARLLGFGTFRPAGGFDNSLLMLPNNEIFNPSNLGLKANNKGGFLLLEGTNPTYAYTASSELMAAYLMGDSRIGEKLRLVYGVRMESFNQKLNSFLNFTDKLELNTDKTDFLPSLNAVYSLNAKQNLRFSYSKTLNRPEFRELAPFAFFDFNNNIVVGGNPNLVRATIDNLDLRYEVYPGRGQVLSVSGFYKKFINPIELVSDPNNFNSTAYQNAIDAENFGVEVEFRTLVGALIGKNDNEFLNRFTASANAAFISSRVQEAPFAGVIKALENRTLQGQSPYLFNTSIAYIDPIKGWSSTISANRVGQRIFIVGSINEPDTWEQGRTILDFQIAKTILAQKMEIKLNWRDMLRQDQIFFLDGNKNNRYNEGVDKIFQARNFGSVLSFNVSYRF